MARILIDAREFRTSTGRSVERLLHYLQEVDHEHSYQVLLKPKDIEGWKAHNPKFHKVSCKYKEFGWGEQLGLWWQIHKLRADLVHFAMVQQPVLYGGKVVTTMQDLTTARFKNPSKNRVIFTLKQWVYKRVNKRVAHKSKAIIVPSEFVKDDVARYTRTNSRKISVTYEAAEMIAEEPGVVEGLEETKFIMYVGRPQPHKNLDRLVEAFILLKREQPYLKLVLAG